MYERWGTQRSSSGYAPYNGWPSEGDKGKGKGKGKSRGKGKWKQSGGLEFEQPASRGPHSFVLLHDKIEPRISHLASYSYAKKGEDEIHVVSPAWPVRKLLWPAATTGVPTTVDLSLARGLTCLQLSNGSFKLTSDLTAVLGLSNSASALEHSKDEEADVIATLLVLKCLLEFQPSHGQCELSRVWSLAMRFCSDTLGHTSDEIQDALQRLAGANFESLPGHKPLLENFEVGKDRWSFYELQVRVMPQHSLGTALSSIFCPRFFLVDLACAPLSFYDVHKSYPLLRRGNMLWFGSGKKEASEGGDAMRQGQQFEAALVSKPWHEEDHLLTLLELGSDIRAIYSAAPDAVDPDWGHEPLEADSYGYAAAGYEEVELLPPLVDDEGRQAVAACRVHKLMDGEAAAAEEAVPPDHFVEVKKTTHLNGRPGAFKKLKFYVQAALAKCRGTLVGLTQGSSDGDVVTDITFLSLQDLAAELTANKVQRMWATLAEMLRYILLRAGEDGPWTLTVKKAKGDGMPTELFLEAGWGSDTSSAMLEQRMADVVAWLDTQT